MKLTHKEWATILHALQVAESQARTDKKTQTEANNKKLAEAFEILEINARVLHAKIEEADLG